MEDSNKSPRKVPQLAGSSAGRSRAERWQCPVVLLVFAIVFVILTVSSYTQKSATWDEPPHLTAGYAMLKLHDYRIGPEAPPFTRMWAALPLLFMPDIKIDANSIHDTDNDEWMHLRQYSMPFQFTYQQNDADRLLYPARFMTVLLGIALGILVFSWARELFGFWPAAVVLGLYCFEPNILAHSSLVTTDLGFACFFFGTIYFLWRTTRSLTLGNLMGLSVCLAMAVLSKFSAVLLGPIIFGLLLLRVWQRDPWPWKIGMPRKLSTPSVKTLTAASIVAALALVAYVGIWAVYGFRYAPSASGTEQFHFQDHPFVLQQAHSVAKAVDWVDRHRLLPNAFTEGFLFGSARAQMRSAFLMGKFSAQGWWYYFPVAFLIKTPLTLLVLFGVGVGLCLKRPHNLLRTEIFLLLPFIFYLGTAMTAKINIGLRHILPIYPFVILIAGRSVAELARVRRGFLVIPVLLGVMECAWVYPDYLTFFNGAVGGPSNGYKYLVDSNLDWGQDLKPLKKWMDKNNLERINLAYFGTADPAYYGIQCIYLPGSPFFAEDRVRSPQLPGYVAVSVTNLRGVYLNDLGRAFYAKLLAQEPVAVIGYSIHVYWMDKPWWVTGQ